MYIMDDPIYRDSLIELFIFIGIVLAVTVMLSISAFFWADATPPHAGLDVKDDGEYVKISVTTMGQSDRVTVLTNGSVYGKIRSVSESVRVKKTENKSKEVLIVSDNGQQALILREMSV